MNKSAVEIITNGGNYGIGKVVPGSPAMSFLITRNAAKVSMKKKS